MPDAKEWEKIAQNLVITRSWLYRFYDDYEQDPQINEEIQIARYLLTNCLEIIDKLAKFDDKGWLKEDFD